MGRVYKALDKEINEEVAIKLLKPEIASDESTVERFRNELKFARKIAHKNVCKMFHLAKEEETPYITMEYVKGEDLKSYVRRKGKLADEEAISIAKQVCEGLAAAHELGVIHRDLKPQNIMIDEEGIAKVMDFGIARSVEAAGVTQTGVMIGTPDYISPEQAEGEEADQRSDIYSLGVILYEMLTGQVPFKGDTALSVALKHKSTIPEDPRKLNPDISEDLGRLILVCIEKDRDRRYKTAELLLADLVNIEEGLPLGTKIKPRRETFASAIVRKKLFIPALVLVLAIIAVIIWQVLPSRETVPTQSGKSSIAVLPFVDLSPEKDQEYFSDGLAEELINRLTRIKSLSVQARTSSFSFKGKDLSIQDIGRALKVDTVLEGSVRKAGNQLRVTAQLINVEDGYHLWSERFDREMDDVFSLQDEISLAIVDKLQVEILGEEKEKLLKSYTENSEAYNLYLKGHYQRQKLTKDGFLKGIEYFNAAIESDPTFALAYSGLALLYGNYAFWGNLPPNDFFPKARIAAEKALELDETVADARSAIAIVNMYIDWNWEGAERELKRAIELNPKLSQPHVHYSYLLLFTKREEEAIREIKLALELDPLSSTLMGFVGYQLCNAQRYDEAIEKTKEWIEMDPYFYQFYNVLGIAYFSKSMVKEAIKEFEKAQELYPGETMSLLFLETAYYLSGRKNDAEEIFASLRERAQKEYIPPVFFSIIHLIHGELEESVKWLEKAYEEHDVWLPIMSLPGQRQLVPPGGEYIFKKMGLE